jgi:hypothetical protein
MAVNVDVQFLPNIGNHLVALRVAMDALVRDGTYINAMGGAALFEAAPFNLLSGDAQFIATNIGAVTADNSVVESVYAFLEACVGLTGGD